MRIARRRHRTLLQLCTITIILKTLYRKRIRDVRELQNVQNVQNACTCAILFGLLDVLFMTSAPPASLFCVIPLLMRNTVPIRIMPFENNNNKNALTCQKINKCNIETPRNGDCNRHVHVWPHQHISTSRCCCLSPVGRHCLCALLILLLLVARARVFH